MTSLTQYFIKCNFQQREIQNLGMEKTYRTMASNMFFRSYPGGVLIDFLEFLLNFLNHLRSICSSSDRRCMIFLYSQIRLKRTVSAQQIFQSLVRNKQFKFSRVFEIKTNLDELADKFVTQKTRDNWNCLYLTKDWNIC